MGSLPLSSVHASRRARVLAQSIEDELGEDRVKLHMFRHAVKQTRPMTAAEIEERFPTAQVVYAAATPVVTVPVVTSEPVVVQGAFVQAAAV